MISKYHKSNIIYMLCTIFFFKDLYRPTSQKLNIPNMAIKRSHLFQAIILGNSPCFAGVYTLPETNSKRHLKMDGDLAATPFLGHELPNNSRYLHRKSTQQKRWGFNGGSKPFLNNVSLQVPNFPFCDWEVHIYSGQESLK